MPEISINSIWKHVANNNSPLYHRVLDVSPHEELGGTYVATWSYPVQSESIAGYSWYGPVEEFLKQFKKA